MFNIKACQETVSVKPSHVPLVKKHKFDKLKTKAVKISTFKQPLFVFLLYQFQETGKIDVDLKRVCFHFGHKHQSKYMSK